MSSKFRTARFGSSRISPILSSRLFTQSITSRTRPRLQQPPHRESRQAADRLPRVARLQPADKVLLQAVPLLQRGVRALERQLAAKVDRAEVRLEQAGLAKLRAAEVAEEAGDVGQAEDHSERPQALSGSCSRTKLSNQSRWVRA